MRLQRTHKCFGIVDGDVYEEGGARGTTAHQVPEYMLQLTVVRAGSRVSDSHVRFAGERERP